MNELLIKLLTSNPEIISGTVKEYINKYKPMVYEIVGDVYSIYKDYVANEEHYIIDAEYYKNKLDAYMNAGFSREEAMSLILKDSKDLEKALSNTKINSKNISK